MYCTNCGSDNLATSRFCGNCGASANIAIPPAAAQAERSSHIRLLGILWIAESALRLVPGLVLLALFGAGGALISNWLPFGLAGVLLVWMPILALIGAILSITAIGGAIAGWGLLGRKPWARTFALILALFSLPHLPFGTALGVYTLWVLLPAEESESQRSRAASELGAVHFN